MRQCCPAIYPHTGRDPRRALDTPPRPRAKCSGFYALLRPPPSRASAGLAGKNGCMKIMRIHAELCTSARYV